MATFTGKSASAPCRPGNLNRACICGNISTQVDADRTITGAGGAGLQMQRRLLVLTGQGIWKSYGWRSKSPGCCPFQRWCLAGRAVHAERCRCEGALPNLASMIAAGPGAPARSIEAIAAYRRKERLLLVLNRFFRHLVARQHAWSGTAARQQRCARFSRRAALSCERRAIIAYFLSRLALAFSAAEEIYI